MQENRVQFLGWEDPPEKGMETHSSILAWEIPRTEEPGGLHSPGDHKELDTTEWLRLHFHSPWKWMITRPNSDYHIGDAQVLV